MTLADTAGAEVGAHDGVDHIKVLSTGAVLTRVAASHIRVGTFQFFAARAADPAPLRAGPTSAARGAGLRLAA